MEVQKLAYRLNEAAEALGVSPQTIARLIKAGELPSFTMGSSRLVSTKALEEYIDKKDLEEYIDKPVLAAKVATRVAAEGGQVTKNADNIYRMLTVDETADLLGVSERKVRQMIADEALPSWKPSPGVVRIPYWMIIWRVSKENGMDLEEMLKPVTGAVTRLTGA